MNLAAWVINSMKTLTAISAQSNTHGSAGFMKARRYSLANIIQIVSIFPNWSSRWLWNQASSQTKVWDITIPGESFRENRCTWKIVCTRHGAQSRLPISVHSLENLKNKNNKQTSRILFTDFFATCSHACPGWLLTHWGMKRREINSFYINAG